MERVPDPAAAALLADEVLGGAGRIAVDPCTNGVLVGADQHGAALPGPSDFYTLFPGDPIKPRLHGGVPTEAWHPFKSRQKDLLGDLLRQFLIE